ncbi:XkdX family protein [Anaerotignum sp.]|nr:XkdX family protein [Anaerotignum sp.]MCI7658137.1 XkdX family protein [Clostridia bacterium]MDY5414581.1 XkdX family protein [Anaerotignum sp.]
MYEILKKKYKLGYVRKDQLLRYLALGKLTEEEYKDIVQS